MILIYVGILFPMWRLQRFEKNSLCDVDIRHTAPGVAHHAATRGNRSIYEISISP